MKYRARLKLTLWGPTNRRRSSADLDMWLLVDELGRTHGFAECTGLALWEQFELKASLTGRTR